MALDDDVRILSGVSLFASMSEDQLRLLAFGAERVHFAAGEEVYRRDDPADTAFLVLSGRIQLLREEEGQRLDVGFVGPGALMGELALIADTHRPTSAVAVSDCELMRLDRKLFQRILREYPEVAAALHDRIIAELQAMIRRIEALADRLEP
jgi:CRP-like cAMP-binding protein